MSKSPSRHTRRAIRLDAEFTSKGPQRQSDSHSPRYTADWADQVQNAALPFRRLSTGDATGEAPSIAVDTEERIDPVVFTGRAVLGSDKRVSQRLHSLATYEDVYKLTYVRGPSGILVMLAEELKKS